MFSAAKSISPSFAKLFTKDEYNDPYIMFLLKQLPAKTYLVS